MKKLTTKKKLWQINQILILWGQSGYLEKCHTHINLTLKISDKKFMFSIAYKSIQNNPVHLVHWVIHYILVAFSAVIGIVLILKVYTCLLFSLHKIGHGAIVTYTKDILSETYELYTKNSAHRLNVRPKVPRK